VETPIRFRGLARAEVLSREVPVATSFVSRLLGLALLRPGRAGPGLLIPRCRRVHTFGMWFSLDVVFLDERQRVVEVRRQVPPRRLVRCPEAMAVLELPSP
jgi:uncharacterized membrane protein (UPF0127 family)